MSYEQNVNKTITTEFNHNSDIGVLSLEITPPIPWWWKTALKIVGELHLVEITGVAHVWFWPAVLAANIAHQTKHDQSPRQALNIKLREDTVNRIKCTCKVFVMQNTGGDPHYFVVHGRSSKETLNSLNSNVNYRKPITAVDREFTMNGVSTMPNAKWATVFATSVVSIVLQLIGLLANLHSLRK